MLETIEVGDKLANGLDSKHRVLTVVYRNEREVVLEYEDGHLWILDIEIAKNILFRDRFLSF